MFDCLFIIIIIVIMFFCIFSFWQQIKIERACICNKNKPLEIVTIRLKTVKQQPHFKWSVDTKIHSYIKIKHATFSFISFSHLSFCCFIFFFFIFLLYFIFLSHMQHHVIVYQGTLLILTPLNKLVLSHAIATFILYV